MGLCFSASPGPVVKEDEKTANRKGEETIPVASEEVLLLLKRNNLLHRKRDRLMHLNRRYQLVLKLMTKCDRMLIRYKNSTCLHIWRSRKVMLEAQKTLLDNEITMLADSVLGC